MYHFKTLGFRTMKIYNITISRIESKFIFVYHKLHSTLQIEEILARRRITDKSEKSITMLYDDLLKFSFT